MRHILFSFTMLTLLYRPYIQKTSQQKSASLLHDGQLLPNTTSSNEDVDETGRYVVSMNTFHIHIGSTLN